MYVREGKVQEVEERRREVCVVCAWVVLCEESGDAFETSVKNAEKKTKKGGKAQISDVAAPQPREKVQRFVRVVED